LIFDFYQRMELRITKVVTETKDTKSFYLEPIDKVAIDYKAGQFLTLLIQHNKREVRRSYSLGSTPFHDKRLFITVKRKVNGEISRYLLDHFKEGDKITALAPSGRFIIYQPLSAIYFFIVAGSGITPVFALIKDLLYHHSSTRIILINQCRNEENIIYKKELIALQTQFNERFEIMQFFSRPVSDEYAPSHLNNELLQKILEQQTFNFHPSDLNFYLCGPVAFMRMAEFTIKLIGFSNDQIRKEHFVIDTPPQTPLLTDTVPKKIIVHHLQKTFHIEVAYPTSILDAALNEGIELPYSCKGGRCSTCAAFCINGKILMSMNEVLTEKDIAKGLVLTCVGFAATDSEISFEF
jgi:ring-1,2-phenylacetyl-CoA epoxidase subunit PaaE